MSKLSDMPNIGSILEKLLIDVDIESPERLKEIGSREAFTRIKVVDNSACLNKLYALEGAVQGMRWHSLSQGCKDDLKEFFKSFS